MSTTTCQGQTIELVTSMKYLRDNVNSQWNPKEILSRIEQVRKTLMSMTFFPRSNLSLKFRIRIFRCYIFSVLLYWCESWIMDPQTEKGIQAFDVSLQADASNSMVTKNFQRPDTSVHVYLKRTAEHYQGKKNIINRR